jgi:hypothetical protein
MTCVGSQRHNKKKAWTMEYISLLHTQSARLGTAYYVALSNKVQSIICHKPDILSESVYSLEKQQTLELPLAIFIHSTPTNTMGKKHI